VFHAIDNPSLLAYSRATDDRSNAVLVIVNLDPHHKHGGWLSLDLAALGVPPDAPFQVHDLMGDARYFWRGPRAFVELDPSIMPLHLFRVHRHERSETSFEYYL
jgi:starch synthase (maltosyl-transferring)